MQSGMQGRVAPGDCLRKENLSNGDETLGSFVEDGARTAGLRDGRFKRQSAPVAVALGKIKAGRGLAYPTLRALLTGPGSMMLCDPSVRFAQRSGSRNRAAPQPALIAPWPNPPGSTYWIPVSSRRHQQETARLDRLAMGVRQRQ
jgi:hypothetical protein